MTVETQLLRLEGAGVPPYSVRGVVQTLDPVPDGVQMRRSINGTLDDLSDSNFRKYMSTISCEDQQPPAFGGLWPGMLLTVYCVAEIAYETNTGGAERTAVPDSSRVEGDFTFYRPILVMRVVNFTQSRNQWGAVVAWRLDLAEV